MQDGFELRHDLFGWEDHLVHRIYNNCNHIKVIKEKKTITSTIKNNNLLSSVFGGFGRAASAGYVSVFGFRPEGEAFSADDALIVIIPPFPVPDLTK